MVKTDVEISTQRTIILTIMVGLPGTGKSSFASLLKIALQKRNYVCKVFNAGEIRRSRSDVHSWRAQEFISQQDTLDDIGVLITEEALHYLSSAMKNSVAIIDRTHVRKTSRNKLWDKLLSDTSKPIPYIIHMKSKSQKVPLEVCRQKTKLSDYDGYDTDLAMQDFLKRHEIYSNFETDIRKDKVFLDNGFLYSEIWTDSEEATIAESPVIPPAYFSALKESYYQFKSARKY